jgi:hypothetical protein
MKTPRPIEDLLLRRRYRAMLRRMFDGGYRVRIARTREDYLDAFRLVRIGYVYQGYMPVRSPELRIFDQHVLPESVVLIATHDEQVVGTLTLIADSPARLPLDRDYPEELATLRRRSSDSLYEVGALTVLRPYQGTGVTQLLTTMSFWLAHNIFDAQRLVIGINPKAVGWHRATMAFEPLGPLRTHADLAAPVAAMTCHLPTLRAFQRRHFPEPLADGHCLEHLTFETLPAAIESPPVRSLDSFNRWKLPRHVFRSLFIEGSDHLQQLDQVTRRHLARRRSPTTLEVSTNVASGG